MVRQTTNGRPTPHNTLVSHTRWVRPEGIELAHVWERVMDTLCRTSADARVPLTDMWLAFTLFAKCNRGAYDTGVATPHMNAPALVGALFACACAFGRVPTLWDCCRAPLADLKARMFARVLGDGESVTPACARRIVEILILTERASLHVCIIPFLPTGTRATRGYSTYSSVHRCTLMRPPLHWCCSKQQAVFRATRNVQQKPTL